MEEKRKRNVKKRNVNTTSIGEIILAKASNGDLKAQKVVTKLMLKGE